MESDQQFCFYKINTYHSVQIFTEPSYYQLLFDALTFLKKKYKFELFAYVLMPNQLDLITSGNLSENSSIFTDTLKTITRNEITKLLEIANKTKLLEQLEIAKRKKKYRIWEVNPDIEDFSGLEKLANRIDKLHNKPVLADLKQAPEAYPYSSAKFYMENIPTEIKISDYRVLQQL